MKRVRELLAVMVIVVEVVVMKVTVVVVRGVGGGSAGGGGGGGVVTYWSIILIAFFPDRKLSGSFVSHQTIFIWSRPSSPSKFISEKKTQCRLFPHPLSQQ